MGSPADEWSNRDNIRHPRSSVNSGRLLFLRLIPDYCRDTTSRHWQIGKPVPGGPFARHPWAYDLPIGAARSASVANLALYYGLDALRQGKSYSGGRQG